MIGKFDGGWQSDGRNGKGGGGEERRAINDALEHVTLRNASAAICRHIYYLGDTSIRPLIIILITASTQTMYSACVTVLMTLSLINTIYFLDIEASVTLRNHLHSDSMLIRRLNRKKMSPAFLKKDVISRDSININDT